MSGPSSYQPRTGIERWLDARLPIVRMIYDQFVAYPTPINLNYSYAFGAILTVFLAVQIVSGIVLAMHYVGHESQAFASIEHIMRDVNYGWLIRYIHMNGASFFFFAVYVHTFRGLYYGSYKAPREMLWILGVLLLILMMATAFMGYVLPWGQMSFWGATVITNLFSALPFIGEPIVSWLWGGYTVGGPTLTRFYSLHYLLPFVIAGIVVLHIWALHVAGQTNPTGVEPKLPTDTARFTPYAVSKDAVAIGVVLIAFAWFVFYVPNYLGHADNYIPANPGVTPSHIVPEWYLLPFYAILRAIPSKLGGVLAMFGALIVLMFVPWLDISKVKSARYRPIYRIFFWLFVANCLVLGWLGAMPPEGIYPVIARVCTVWYFGHFLVLLPLIGRFETPRPLPESITADVLARSGGKAGH